MSNDFISIIQTNRRDYVLFVLRLTLAALLVPHSFREISSLSTLDRSEIPLLFLTFNVLIMVIEFISVIMIAGGALTRIASTVCLAVLPYHLTMEDMPLFEYLPFGIGFTWIGDYKMYIVLIALNTIFAIRGGGLYSFDALLQTKRSSVKNV